MDISNSDLPNINYQNLNMEMPPGQYTFSEEILEGEVDDIRIDHIAFIGPMKKDISLQEGYVSMFFFLTGYGSISAHSNTKKIAPQSIAIPLNGINYITLGVPAKEELHFLKITKKLSLQDLEDLKDFPEENNYDLYFTHFEDCEPYTEKIKSPNTISRTVLPADIVPRVSLGTVEAMGPDKVGAHKHPMLDQLFLGLEDNDIVVYADNVSTKFGAYSLLHIPIGSSHWVQVDENKKMNYLWMDFFLTKEGQEWLKTHKPLKDN